MKLRPTCATPLRATTLSLALLAAHATVTSAAPPSNSAYTTDPQHSFVEDATSHEIGQVNMITCVMAAMKPAALVNDGAYIALVDQTKCDPESRSSSSNSGASSDGAQAASYMTATVDSTRASNDDPMRAKVWVDENEDGHQATIYVNVSATQPPSDSNPYGVFRLDFCGKGTGMNECMMNGYLEGKTDGIDFYQNEGDEGEGRTHTTALKLIANGTTSGSGKLHSIQTENGQSQDVIFSFAYDQDYFLRANDNGAQCFARDATDPETGLSVWRYGLYDATSGDHITRNSGFPIEYTDNGTTYRGYLGYHGLHLPPEASDTLDNGDTVQKVDYSGGNEPTRTNYQVIRAGGKLMKYTRHTRTLQSMDKIKFNTFVDNNANAFFAGAQANTQYEVYWDQTSGTFIASGLMNCGENGCQTQDLSELKTVSISYWTSRGGVQGWSQSLGGEVFIDLHNVGDTIDSAAVQVVYRTQDLVYPSDLPTTLYCLQNCPTAASLQAYFVEGSSDSPYVQGTFNNWNPTPVGSQTVYGTDAASATLRDGVNQAVVFTDAEAYRQHPQFQWGVRSGRLFPAADLASVQCETAQGGTAYCDWKVNSLEIYYQWETGANTWNQFAAVKDGSDNFLEFDAPLQVNFQVPDEAAYGQYRGKSIVLQYGGYGDLWGIPGYCVSRLTNAPASCDGQNSRYVPAFVIPFDETVGRVTEGSNTYLVKWLEREIRFAKKNTSVCSDAGLTVPSDMTLPTAADLKDPSNSASDIYIGVKPTVTDAPRVIHGEVKY